MKRLLPILLLFVSIVSLAQDMRTVDWKTKPADTRVIGIDTFKVTVNFIDINDKGVGQIEVGYYLVDWIARAFEIIAFEADTITVVDLASENLAPTENQIAHIYETIVSGDTLFKSIGGVDVSTIDDLSRWKGVARNNELFGRAIQAKQDTMPFETIDFDTTVSPYPDYQQGRTTWNQDDNTIDIQTGIDSVTIQVGLEGLAKVFNNTADTLFNGRALAPAGVQAGTGIPYAVYTTSYNHVLLEGEVLLATMDIPPGEEGFAAKWGNSRAINTSGLSLGKVYIAASNPADGTLTSTRPAFPFYEARVGGATLIDSDDGIIFTSPEADPYNTIINIFNGNIREAVNLTIESDGVNIIAILNPAGTQDYITYMFSDGLTLDLTLPDTITLTAAVSDNAPQKNFIYIPQSTKELTVSTTGWPATEAKRLAYSVVKTAATTLTDNGALVNQNANDNIQEETDKRGLVLLITERLRQEPATWARVGCELNSTIDAASAPDDVWVTMTQGAVYQFRKQIASAQDTETGDDIHLANYFNDNWKTVSNMNEAVLDALGNTTANSSFSVVYWWLQNKTGEESHLCANMPTGGYGKNSPQDAVDDLSEKSVYSIPSDYKSVGILLARVTYTLDAGGNTYTVFNIEDLRGTFPNSIAGPSGSGTGVTSFLALLDTESFFTALAFQRANAGGTALENVLASAILLTEFDSTGFTLEQSQVVGLGDSLAAITWQKTIDNGTATVTNLINTGGLKSSGDVEIEKANPQLQLDHTAAGQTSSIYFRDIYGTATSRIQTAGQSLRLRTSTSGNDNLSITGTEATFSTNAYAPNVVSGTNVYKSNAAPADIDDITASGFYYGGASSVPTGLNSMITHSHSTIDGYSLQIAARLDEYYIRTEENSTWATWKELYHSGNSNLSTVDWNAKDGFFDGTVTADEPTLDTELINQGKARGYVTGGTEDADFLSTTVGILKDKDGDAGTSGQILSSTVTGTDWIANSSLSLGTNQQIPYMNVGGTDFIYTNNLTFDGDILTIRGRAFSDKYSNDILGAQTTSGTINLDTDSGQDSETITLTGNSTLNINNLDLGQSGTILIRQDATGGYTLTIATYTGVVTGALVEHYVGGVTTIQTGANDYTVVRYERLNSNVIINIEAI